MNYSALLLWFFFVLPLILYVLTTATRYLFANKLPPGPFPLPIVGNFLKLGNNVHVSLAKLAKIYGPLMTLKFGTVTTIVVSSAKMAQEVLQKHDNNFSGRTVPDAMQILGHHEASIVWSQTSLYWRNMRKLCVSQMFTTQRLNSNEQLRLMKVKGLTNYIQDMAKSRCALNIGQAVFSTTLSIISCNVFSIDLTLLESSKDFKDVICGVMEEAGRPNLADFFPAVRRFDPQGIKKRTAKYFQKLDSIFDRVIDQRLQSKEEDRSIDVLDTLLHHSQEDGSKLPHSNIKSILKDLFIAGTDTTTVTLEWAMAELLRNPNIMAKARLELKQTIDKDTPIEESDRARLPYLQAIVKETMRLHPSVPLLIPHRADTNTDICGFTVPKHAQVLVNTWAIGRDPDIWINPTSFLPDRFLCGSNIDFRGQNFKLIPFGAGRRICPGLPLAYRMVHLMLASLLYRFDWELENGMTSQDINMEEIFGLALQKSKPLYAIPVEA